MTTRVVLQWVIMTSGVDHNDWLIGYMDHNDYDSFQRVKHIDNDESR